MFLQSCKDLFQVNQSENYGRLYHQNLIISKRFLTKYGTTDIHLN